MSRAEQDAEADGQREVTPAVWTRLGLTPERELHTGHQSRVFLATGPRGPVVVKLIENGRSDEIDRLRVELTLRLSEVLPAVVGPIPIGSDLVVDIGGWQASCYPPVDGRPPDIDDDDEVALMATTLVALHRTLARLAPGGLPPVAALAATGPDDPLRSDRVIHGDYAATNLILDPGGLRILDFADCGTGSLEFEIGNSLSLVLFDAWHTDDRARYERFRHRFVLAYREAAPGPVDADLIDAAIRVRIAALRSWLETPSEAPTGIRTASPAWHRHLRTFVDTVEP